MGSNRRQIGWGLVDQGFSSATNFGGSVLAARMLSSHEFGGFAVGFSLYLIVLGLSRSWSSEPLMVRFAAASREEQGEAIRQGAAASIAVGATGGLALAAASPVLWESVGRVLLATAVLLPALTLQDYCRYALIVRRRSRDAALNDLVWLVVLLVAFAGVRSQHLTATTAVVLWALGAIAASALGLAQLHCLPAFASVVGWARRQHDLSWRYSGEFVLLSGSAILLTVGLGAIGGLSDAAGFRGAQVALGPLGVLFMGATMQMTPIMVVAARSGGERLRQIGRNISAVLGSFAGLWGTALLLIPDGVGAALLGSSWSATRPLIPIWAAYYLASGLASGATIGLRSSGAARTSLRLRALVAPIGLTLGLLGALLDGPRGASIGLLIGNAVALPMWWRAFLKVCAAHGAAPMPEALTTGKAARAL